MRKKTDFSEFLKKLRTKSDDEMSLDEITKEVEMVSELRNEKDQL